MWGGGTPNEGYGVLGSQYGVKGPQMLVMGFWDPNVGLWDPKCGLWGLGTQMWGEEAPHLGFGVGAALQKGRRTTWRVTPKVCLGGAASVG